MRGLTRQEWIVVTIALVVVVVFIGPKFFNKSANNPVVDQLGAVGSAADQNLNNNTNNNVDQNTNAATSTPGFIVKDVVVGTGAEAKNGDLVEVQYTGKFTDGKVFDSSVPRGQPLPFTLGAGMVIKGWDLGILGMKVGGKRALTIPPTLGYGANGYPPVIPPNATLYFDVELVGVKLQ